MLSKYGSDLKFPPSPEIRGFRDVAFFHAKRSSNLSLFMIGFFCND